MQNITWEKKKKSHIRSPSSLTQVAHTLWREEKKIQNNVKKCRHERFTWIEILVSAQLFSLPEVHFQNSNMSMLLSLLLISVTSRFAFQIVQEGKEREREKERKKRKKSHISISCRAEKWDCNSTPNCTQSRQHAERNPKVTDASAMMCRTRAVNVLRMRLQRMLGAWWMLIPRWLVPSLSCVANAAAAS